MSDVVGFCAHCMAYRNMRAMQEKRILADKKRTVTEIIKTYHCETCGLFVKDEYSGPVSWDHLISSLDKFSTDFMAERKQPKIQTR